MADDVELDEAAIHELLNSADGPVGRMLIELTEQAAAVARARVRIRRLGSDDTGRSSDARPPGFTRLSIRPRIWWHDGLIYGGVLAPANPTIFLEYPAEQMERTYPFLTTGLWSLEGTF